MNYLRLAILVLSSFMLIALSSCGGGGGGGSENQNDSETITRIPIADAGLDLSAEIMTSINLDSSRSYSENGSITSYLWSIISKPDGSSPTITGLDTDSPVFCGDVEGAYEIQLVVSDGYSDSFPDVVGIALYKTEDKPGSLDESFGINGKIYTSIGVGSDGSTASDFIVQDDGKIVVVGSTRNGDVNEIALVRYLENGSIDTGFGENGIVTTPYLNDSIMGQSIIGLPDGKYIVASRLENSTRLCLVRYLSNGDIDQSFGNVGFSIFDKTNIFSVSNLIIQADGSLVVGGNTYSNSINGFLLVRFIGNGLLDSSFGGTGYVETTIARSVNAIALQADQKIVAVADAQYDYADSMIIRFNPDGSFDENFGNNGIVTQDDGSVQETHPADVLILETGEIVVASRYMSQYLSIAKYKENGTLDSDFINFGLRESSLVGNYITNSLSVQKDNKLLLAGQFGLLSLAESDQDFLVVRFNQDGTIDEDFGNNGIVTTDIESNNYDSINKIIAKDDGSIICVGFSTNLGDAPEELFGGNSVFSLTKYLQ